MIFFIVVSVPVLVFTRNKFKCELGLALGSLLAIAMSWLVESCVLDFMTLNLAKIFTGFTCAVEFWSFLENASQLSEAPMFVWLKRYVRRRLRKEVEGE